MKCILWSEKICKNTWDEQYYIVILQLYLLINLLNHRVNIMLRERVFNFTASLVGNVTVNRTVTQTFSTFVSATWIRERISFHSATEKRSEFN